MHFHYQLKVFFQITVLNGSVGKVNYCTVRGEFRVCAPFLYGYYMRQFQALMDNIFFPDNIVSVSLPVTDNDPHLFELRKTYQVNSQLIFYQKCKNQAGCCIFGKCFTV